jgi:hypothetical protein
VSPEEKIISRRKRHDSDEGEPEKNHFPLSVCPIGIILHLLWVLCFPIFFGSHSIISYLLFSSLLIFTSIL